jgi:hypothetical protein
LLLALGISTLSLWRNTHQQTKAGWIGTGRAIAAMAAQCPERWCIPIRAGTPMS